MAIGFHRNRQDELIGRCNLKRTGQAGLVGLQRCRLRYIWDPLAEPKGALDYMTALQKMKLGKQSLPMVCMAVWMVVGSLRVKVVWGLI